MISSTKRYFMANISASHFARMYDISRACVFTVYTRNTREPIKQKRESEKKPLENPCFVYQYSPSSPPQLPHSITAAAVVW